MCFDITSNVVVRHDYMREIDPTFVITHRMSLDDAPKGYEMFKDKEDGCVKVVLRP